MFDWKDTYIWEFSDEGKSASNKGPAITGSKMFRGGQYKNVIRETVQNGCDAKDPDLPVDTPVRMSFSYILVKRDEIPGVDNLSTAIDKCYDFMAGLPNAKMDDVEILENANKQYLKSADYIPVLKISDYNTKGLNAINYESLMNNEGITFKTDEDTSGSFGFGKFAPYLLSPVNTILYSSYTENDTFLFQGRTFLSTFKDNGKRKQGTSLFGLVTDERVLPINNPEDVPEVFRRNEKGTDLFILCFEKTNNWIDQMVLSALENFFFAIHLGKLEIQFEDGDVKVVISKENLPDIMDTYEAIYKKQYSDETEAFVFTAPKYWKVLNDSRTKRFVDDDFRNKGEVILYVLVGEELEDRCVLQMRSSGMRIQEDTYFRRLPPFNGIMIATASGREKLDYSKNISKFLREMESPAHNSWLIEDVKKPDIKGEANIVLRDLHNWIRNTVQEFIPKDDGTPIDAFGLSKILPDITEAGDNSIQEDAVFTFVPLTTVAKETRKPSTSRTKKVKTNGRGHNPNPDPQPRPEPDPDKPKVKRDNHQGTKIVFEPVSITSIRTPYIEEDNLFRISFVSEESYQELWVKLKVAGDDANFFDLDIIKARSNGRKVSIKDGYIVIPKVKKMERVYCDVTIAESGGYAMEVTAYVKRQH